MTKAEVLMKAAGIVSALIKSKTPDVSGLAAAHEALGKVIATTKGLSPGDAIPADIATGVNAVIERMESFRSGYVSNDPSQKIVDKAFTVVQFAEYVKSEVDAVEAEPNKAKALKRLHGVAGQIAKALADVSSLGKASSIEDTTPINLPVFVDAAQIVPTDSTTPIVAAAVGAPTTDPSFTSAQGGSAAVAGNAKGGSAVAQGSGAPGASNYDASKAATPPAPVANPADVLAAATAVVEKSTSAPEFEGWPLDLNAPKRKSEVHFGKDPLRPRA